VLLIAAAVVILLLALAANQWLQGRHSETPVPGAPPVSSTGKSTGPAEPKAPPAAPESGAECRITNHVSYITRGSVIVRGQVVNTGSAPAESVEVRVVVLDRAGVEVTHEDAPVEPVRIEPGRHGEFRVEVLLPPLSTKPKVTAQVRWD
jgi:hypothetical protein